MADSSQVSTPCQLTQDSSDPNSSSDVTGTAVDNSPAPNGTSGNSSGAQTRRSRRFTNSTEMENGSTEKSSPVKKRKSEQTEAFFIGESIPENEARCRWPWRYGSTEGQVINGQTQKSDDDDDDELVLNVKCHFSQAQILNAVFDLGDCAYVKGPMGGKNYVGKILEFFQTVEGEDYCRVQWFFRAEDTVLKEDGKSHDESRLFFSTLMNDNLLDCLVSKVKVVQIAPQVYLNETSIPPCDFYFDMKYSVDYSTFSSLTAETVQGIKQPINRTKEDVAISEVCEPKLALLDMYSGCGGMSTGLCLGAKACGLDVVTRWAVDVDRSACESLKLNHPETQIRNESAEDFLDLLKEWDALCRLYETSEEKDLEPEIVGEVDESKRSKPNSKSSDEYEVEKLVDICYSDPNKTGSRGLRFKVRWIGYGSGDDTWEPIEGLDKCEGKIRDFVLYGKKVKLLPRPGDVGVICGGPPCQGISGYNRFRNVKSPLEDERNRQIIIFMDIINFLRPKYVLMENVIDILRFADGCLGRYALSRLVRMHYQARLGIMAAGCYGLPQFRLRVFLLAAHPHEVLPKFPLPTHDVIIQYGFPSEFERNVVAYNEGQSRNLEKIVVLRDAISDLPPVTNAEKREKRPYKSEPETEFQKYIRTSKCDMTSSASSDTSTPKKPSLYDHRPYPLGDDDYLRVCKIPKRKGANFRDLPGIVIGSDNVVRRAAKSELMPSGKPWVPDYALNFRDGRSTRPFGRLWWDETVATVFCFPDPHSRALIHPEQDRLLTLRECARLQGFHDDYKFCGTLKERYSQVGNAVAVSVGRALGYSVGMAALHRNVDDDGPLMTLPPKFSHSSTPSVPFH